MLTPQEVSARSFTKAVMGGYNMAMVDEFLDELTKDYTSLYKENATLKAKMKVLVDKVEEYRATEDSMRATLLAVQRTADSIVKEAEEKRGSILQQAEAAARDMVDNYRKEADQHTKRLQQSREEIQRFIAESKALCQRELQFLEKFSNTQLEEEEEKSFAVGEIGEKVLATQKAVESAVSPAPADPSAGQAAPAVQAAQAIPVVQAPQAAPTVPTAQPTQAAPSAPMSPVEKLLDILAAAESVSDDLGTTRRVNINELKFGPNYRSGAD